MNLLTVRDLKVHFPIMRGVIRHRQVGTVKAVDGVDLDIRATSTYGLVGESGCGKSTLGRALLRLVEPTSGSVHLDGTDILSLREEPLRRMRSRMQMVFQDPMASLNPRQSVYATLTEPLAAHGITMSAHQRQLHVRELLDSVGLPADAADKYPHEFSGGQRQRIGIARAITLKPDLLIADEPVSALDVSVQAQVINLLEELQEQLQLTFIVIAHDLAVVRHISETVGVMYLGGIVEEGAADDLYVQPMHPYTISLLSAVPIPDPVAADRPERIVLRGDLPSPADPPSGCRFNTRCPFRQETRCGDERPELREVAPDHKVACHYAEAILTGEITPRVESRTTVLTGEGRTSPQ
ncbi:ABC transporter ATP-binding protein [Brevibacterium album]|uniref:ABC transporter ATP-binding protein n=1 Tax=Brevibacterium album TaxID=417948 RepID=UPI0003F6060F|nr:oligopeptide/dipeptide ABC transporter ATP-binding protein [Brevibacterium album]